MKRIATILGIAGLLVGLVVACSVSFNPGEENKFPCDSDEDCLEGQFCTDADNVEGVNQKVCADEDQNTQCNDEDDDGYGVGITQNCNACTERRPRGCEEDCKPEDPDVFPGQVEFCNNQDDNCNPDDDDDKVPIGQESCANPDNRECPLNGVKDEPQDRTSWGCAQIDGEWQCVLKGSFANRGCNSAEGFGTCQDGSWTKVPDKCTSPG